MLQRSQGLRVGRGLHPPLYRANPRAQGPNAAHLQSLALMVTPALLPSVPPHNRVSPRHPHHLPCQERGRPDPGEEQGLPLGSATLPFGPASPAHPRGFLAGLVGTRTVGLVPAAEWSRAQPMDWGAPEGVWLGTAVAQALAGGSPCWGDFTLLLSHTLWHQWKRGTPTPAHTPHHVSCSSTLSPRTPFWEQ